MNGPYYLDTLAPLVTADIASVTLAGTNKALYPAASFPAVGANFFDKVGKAIWVHLFGRITTVATPANLTFNIYWGSGADATGTIIQSSAAIAMTASQTNLAWMLDLFVKCTAIGSAGALFATGCFECNNAVIANTLQPILIPASAPATSASVDLTAASIVSVQVQESGTPSATMLVHDLRVVALN